jgi:hypothetical protein
MDSLTQLKHKIETTINNVKVRSFNGADLITNKGTFTMALGQFYRNDKPFKDAAMKKFTAKFKYPPQKTHQAVEHAPGKVNPPFVYTEEFKQMWLAALQGKSLKSFETDEDEAEATPTKGKKSDKAVAKTVAKGKKAKQKRKPMSPEARAKLLKQLAAARAKNKK